MYKDSVILEVENELLPYYFLFIFVIIKTPVVYSVNSLPFTTLCYFSIYLPLVTNEPEVLVIAYFCIEIW